MKMFAAVASPIFGTEICCKISESPPGSITSPAPETAWHDDETA